MDKPSSACHYARSEAVSNPSSRLPPRAKSRTKIVQVTRTKIVQVTRTNIVQVTTCGLQ
ncbi:MAG: hypothetical protein WAV05_11460 [Anaerolineales bacterium]